MGYMRHHAIVVTTWDSERAEKARAKAFGLFRDEQVSPVSGEAVNGYRSFCVFPDGSKEGWDTSDSGDDARDKFVAWLEKQRYEDGSTPLDWVEVQYGDDELETKIVRDSDAKARASDSVGSVGGPLNDVSREKRDS